MKLARVAAALVSAAACTGDPPIRPQLVVVIDTDGALVGALANDRTLSPAVAIDTVRIDLVGDDRSVTDYRDLTVPDARDWPLSFGVASAEGTPRTVRLRIRAFRAASATKGILDGRTTVEPRENLAIDRIVELEQPTTAVRTVRVVLATACFGAPATFTSRMRTCVDAARRNEAPSEGVFEGTTAATLAGTAVEAHEQPCAAAPAAGTVCVPGGPSILGDAELAQIVDGPPSTPVRPVLLSPFLIDEREMTVGRFRALLARGAVTEEPRMRDPADLLAQYCTWLGGAVPDNDALPLNCIGHDLAAKACTASGGALPSEAQWEHAARGRGRAFLFPWGDALASCCTASVARSSALLDGACDGAGIEPAGSHRGKGCFPEDVSPDGVVDLAGGVTEMILDGGASYADPCWSGPGLRVDPVCFASDRGRYARGNDWSAGMGLLRSAIRGKSADLTNTIGFRCVYPGR